MKRLSFSVPRLARRSLVLMGALSLVVVVIVATTVIVMGRSETDVFPGTKAVGAHEFWDVSDAEANFCNQCHNQIAVEMTASIGNHPIINCLGCHAITGTDDGHVAEPAKCVDCHGGQAGDLAGADEAHAALLTQLGEAADGTDASWTCKACHTNVDVEMTVTPMGPLQLVMD